MDYNNKAMNCQAKITDLYTRKHIRCTRNEAVVRITVTTIVPHLNKTIIKSKCLCAFHAKRFRNKLNYEIKHLHKNKSYVEELLSGENLKLKQ